MYTDMCRKVADNSNTIFVKLIAIYCNVKKT